ncbi:hypothetical protein BH24ACT1_BH24ACT1_12790 [soil metagenome]
MHGIRRLLALAGLAVVAFAAALFTFDDGAQQGCATEIEPDPAYAVEVQNAPSIGEVAYRLSVTRNGEPVTGAQVCLSANMAGMSAMGVSDDAVEVDSGVYEVEVRFQMAGSWDGTVLVSDGGAESVAVPLSFEVAG